MNTPLNKLLALVDQFPQRKRLEFDNEENRAFIRDVLIALKDAAPAIRALNAPALPLGGGEDYTAASQCPDAAADASPSTPPATAPETAQSSHTQAPTPNTADNAASPDRTADIAGTAAVVDAKLTEARRQAAARPTPVRRRSAPGHPPRLAAAPPATPTTTTETAQA